jgi:hypothetical protein
MPSRRRRASPEWEGREVITVAALPGRGLYVRHLGHPEGVDGVHRPTVPPPGAPASAAWFEPSWLDRHLDEVHVVHVHGLSPRCTPDATRAAAEQVHRAGKPLVLTAYHLSDPTGTDEEQYSGAFGTLVELADAVVTLTEPAAAEIRERWSTEPVVLPHPHAVDFVRMHRERPPRQCDALVVGTHLGSLQGPTDHEAFITALAESVATAGDAYLLVHIHENVLDPGSTSYNLASARRIDETVRAVGGVVQTHRPLSDAQLWDHLARLDVSVVPPTPGSHSIWPEACHDLGTHVVLPEGTHAAAQQPCLTYACGPAGPDVASLVAALRSARGQGPATPADPAQRWAERVGISECLRTLYEQQIAKLQNPAVTAV